MKDAGAPLVSVVMLAYRQPRFLNEAAASVAVQTHPRIELIVVDDASGTEITRQYRLPANARLLVSPERVACAAVSRNIALRHARGEYIAFLDHDDVWLPEKVAVQVAALERSPRALLHFTRSAFIDEEGRRCIRRQSFRRVNLGEDPLKTLLSRRSIAASSVMIRRATLDRVGLFDETIRLASDWDYWLRVAAAGEIIGDPRRLLLYRLHAAQWSRDALAVREATVRVLEKAETWLPSLRPDLRGDVRRAHARALAETGRHQPSAGKLEACRSSLRRSFALSPWEPRIYLGGAGLLAHTIRKRSAMRYM